jgi:hypothetical protein
LYGKSVREHRYLLRRVGDPGAYGG